MCTVRGVYEYNSFIPAEVRHAPQHSLSTEFVSDERATRVEFLFDCLMQSGT